MICCCSISSEVIRDVIVSCSAVTGVVFAYLGLREWKRRHVGEEEINILRKTLIAAYELKKEMDEARFNASFVGGAAIPTDEKILELTGGFDERLSDNEIERRIHLILDYMYKNGLKSLLEAHSKLYGVSTLIEAYFGKDTKSIVTDLLKLDNTLLLNFKFYLQNKYHERETGPRTEAWKIVIATLDNDSFADEIQIKVDKIDAIIKALIKKI